MSDEYPDSPPPKPPTLKGTATVKGSEPNTHFTVNFDTGECDCPHGQAWRWDNRRWVAGNLCNHKLKALASLQESQPADDLFAYYESAVGKRHNAFVAVSAMHKELRRKDVEAALYWATCMIPHRGIVGVINYLRNIVFEETRDIALYTYILRLSSHGRSVSRLDMNRAITRFTLAPKKWELPWRLDIFLDEQRAYKRLATKYSYSVAKPSDIIEKSEHGHLHKTLISGFKTGKREDVQYGLKGLLKSKSDNHDKLKITIFNYLTDVVNGTFPNTFDFDEAYVDVIHSKVLARIQSYGAPGYHELNVLADALTGERSLQSIATLPPSKHRLIVNAPKLYTLPLGDFRRIPLYAHDNHTWPGKALLRQYGATELQPGVAQQHIDYRYCGAYCGVAWRYLAWKQKESITCKWQDVSWRNPPTLWSHVENMNY